LIHPGKKRKAMKTRVFVDTSLMVTMELKVSINGEVEDEDFRMARQKRGLYTRRIF